MGGKIPNELDCCKLVKDSDMGFVGATYNPLTQTCYGETHYDIKIPNLPSDTFKGYTFDKFRTTLGNPNAMKRNIFETSLIFYSMSIYEITLLPKI